MYCALTVNAGVRHYDLSRNTEWDEKVDQGVWTWSTSVSVGSPRSLQYHVKGRYEVRVVVHHVYELVRHGHEIFPDVYVKARILGRGPWMKTDVHEDAVDDTALFNWRLVLERFEYDPTNLHRRGFKTWIKGGAKKEDPPLLEIAVSDRDTLTPDDDLG